MSTLSFPTPLSSHVVPSVTQAESPVGAESRKPSPLRRALASIADMVLFAVCTLGAATIVAVMLPGESSEAFLTALVVSTAVFFAVQIALLFRGQTLGKRLLKERVLVERSGKPAGLLRMLIRDTIGKMISGLFFGLGFWWILFDSKGQGWHDKLVGTVVRTTAD